MLDREASFRLLVALLFNQGIPSNQAFAAPKKLADRLGIERLEAETVFNLGPDALYRVISQKPALHRFTRTMAKSLYAICGLLVRTCGGDPRMLWRGKPEDAALNALISLPGYGRHKAAQALILLNQLGEIPEISEVYIAYMASTCQGFIAHMEQDLLAVVSNSYITEYEGERA